MLSKHLRSVQTVVESHEKVMRVFFQSVTIAVVIFSETLLPALCQVRVLELESQLTKERQKLGELRKAHYQLATVEEGLDANQIR